MGPMWHRDFVNPRALWASVLSKLSDEARLPTLEPIWREIAGRTIVQQCKLDRLCDGELWVRATSASWAREMSVREDELLSRLTGQLGPNVVSRIRFYCP
jgi:predicted nucleic acid-binding Zn ribbon protein